MSAVIIFHGPKTLNEQRLCFCQVRMTDTCLRDIVDIILLWKLPLLQITSTVASVMGIILYCVQSK